MCYGHNVAVRPVQISLDDELLDRIDADPEAQEKGRSAFVRLAVRHYLGAKERCHLEQRLQRAYEGEADAMIDEIAELIGAQEWSEK